jgi:hypothetical protein
MRLWSLLLVLFVVVAISTMLFPQNPAWRRLPDTRL